MKGTGWWAHCSVIVAESQGPPYQHPILTFPGTSGQMGFPPEVPSAGQGTGPQPCAAWVPELAVSIPPRLGGSLRDQS